MQRLEVSGAVRPIYGSLGVKRLKEGKFLAAEDLLASQQDSAPSSYSVCHIFKDIINAKPRTASD